jgi:hypothetical protein
MTKLIPTRRDNKEIKRYLPTSNELAELSDWALRDIGIFLSAPNLDSVKPFWMV